MALLKVSNLYQRFGGLTAVSDFNLEVQQGELIGIIGPNGAGKTTIFNLLSGVYKASQGSINFEGKELIGKKPYNITSLGIARTFQNIRLFKDLTVLDNIRIAHYQDTKYNILESLFHIGSYYKEEDRITNQSLDLLYLFKLDGYRDVLARNLPYGLQRRLEIARALSVKPKLLLLDEPAAGMNPNEINDLMDFIQWIRKKFNLTIILIEHQMRLVMGICERLKVIDFGVTIAEGKPEDIKNNPKVLEAYLGED